MELKVMNCTRKDLDNMTVLKCDKKTKKPKIWVSNGFLLKKDNSDISNRYKDEFEFYNEFEDLKKCVFPEYIWTLDDKKYGYITTYHEEYKSLLSKLQKDKFSLSGKKNILLRITSLIMKLHEYGIIHGDLHGYNIIYDKLDIKLVDFDNIRFDHIESKSIYKKRLKEEINNLNLTLLSILFETFLSKIDTEDYLSLLHDLPIDSEFKKYLISCAKFKENSINEDLPIYINTLRDNQIYQGKNIIKSLKL